MQNNHLTRHVLVLQAWQKGWAVKLSTFAQAQKMLHFFLKGSKGCPVPSVLMNTSPVECVQSHLHTLRTIYLYHLASFLAQSQHFSFVVLNKNHHASIYTYDMQCLKSTLKAMCKVLIGALPLKWHQQESLILIKKAQYEHLFAWCLEIILYKDRVRTVCTHILVFKG